MNYYTTYFKLSINEFPNFQSMPEQVWAKMELNSKGFLNLAKNELTRVVQATQGGNITELSFSMSSCCPHTK